MKQTTTVILLILCTIAFQANSQKFTLSVSPNPATVVVGEQLKLDVRAVDGDNQVAEGKVANFFNLRESGFVPSSGALGDTTGTVTGKIPGTYRMMLFWVDNDRTGFGRAFVDVTVTNAPIKNISINNLPTHLAEGSVIPLDVEIMDEAGFEILDSKVTVSSSNNDVITTDALNNLYAVKPGKASVIVKSGEFESRIDIEIVPNLVDRITIAGDKETARTGDVIHFAAKCWDKEGNELKDQIVRYAVNTSSNPTTSGATAEILSDGSFVAEQPGVYTIVAYSGTRMDQKVVKIAPRQVEREIELVSRGTTTNMRTTDFWVWEGVDGKDYAVTGTLSSGGHAFFWDVTNPASHILIDTITIDARTVNDVKISEDGRICVISSEGSSSRKNGITILDVTNPRDVQIHSRFFDGLTGGIHNLFIYKDHVYALSNGQRYDIINIEDPKNPHRVGRFEIDNPARSIHDVWVVDGIAYSSNWNDGLILVDVGNGIAGGSPSNPVEISRKRIEGDANHTAFPFKNKYTGQDIVIAGDEIFPVDFDLEEVILPRGYLHFIDYTDIENPKEIARYKVPEAGSHNFWVEGDYLYIGYYNGGLRVVDISGELQGDLYKQGREVGFFLPMVKDGYHANNAMTWGAMTHKGHIFFSDLNSGLWSVKLSPVKPDDTKIEVK